jgi:hypothetical protein
LLLGNSNHIWSFNICLSHFKNDLHFIILFMIIMVTISSHIWWISLDVLLRNFTSLNLLLELLESKLLCIFEIAHTILACDLENGTKRKTTTYCRSSF